MTSLIFTGTVGLLKENYELLYDDKFDKMKWSKIFKRHKLLNILLILFAL